MSSSRFVHFGLVFVASMFVAGCGSGDSPSGKNGSGDKPAVVDKKSETATGVVKSWDGNAGVIAPDRGGQEISFTADVFEGTAEIKQGEPVRYSLTDPTTAAKVTPVSGGGATVAVYASRAEAHAALEGAKQGVNLDTHVLKTPYGGFPLSDAAFKGRLSDIEQKAETVLQNVESSALLSPRRVQMAAADIQERAGSIDDGFASCADALSVETDLNGRVGCLKTYLGEIDALITEAFKS